MYNAEKTVSATTRGIIVSYTGAKKHMFIGYETPKHVKKIQWQGTKRYQNIENQSFNRVQKEIYLKAVYGFQAFSPEELATMSKTKRFKVKIVYTKANRILNRWKQEIVNEAVDTLMNSLFPKSSIANQFISVKGYDDNIICNIPFKELGVTKMQIANKLIEYGLLPKNFYQLV